MHWEEWLSRISLEFTPNLYMVRTVGSSPSTTGKHFRRRWFRFPEVRWWSMGQTEFFTMAMRTILAASAWVPRLLVQFPSTLHMRPSAKPTQLLVPQTRHLRVSDRIVR